MTWSGFTRSISIFTSSILSLFSGHLHATPLESKDSKVKKSSQTSNNRPADWLTATEEYIPPHMTGKQYSWKTNIVTTVFWVGEEATPRNPVPNNKSCWDTRWAESFGGTDSPDKSERNTNYSPAAFVPQQNPFYIALPYNDMTSKGHKPEAQLVVPWFREAFSNKLKSVCKGRWIAIRSGTRVCYAQWEDAGPFRTDQWQYVFGNQRPSPNLNGGAGLDVSPAVRDYLGLDGNDLTDWKFVDFSEIPEGPWSWYGENNTFVLKKREETERVARLE